MDEYNDEEKMRKIFLKYSKFQDSKRSTKNMMHEKYLLRALEDLNIQTDPKALSKYKF